MKISKLCKYLIHKVHYPNSPVEIPEFLIKQEITFSLLKADNWIYKKCHANYKL